jgi:transcription initiation factor TFIIH subunit 1
MSQAAAQFKKQAGTLTVSVDGQTVSWKANSGTAAVVITIAEISSMSCQLG